MNFRKTLYFVVDFLFNGSVISKHLKDVSHYLTNEASSTSTVLQRLLVHARLTVSYYGNICNHESLDITDFPIVNKNIFKSHPASFLSSNYTTSQLISLTTSGSTGTPFTVYQDRNKKDRNTADTLVFAEKGGYSLGQKLYYLKIWSEANKKSAITKFIQNIETIDVLKLDDNTIKALLERFESEKNTFGVIGYASALESICRYCEKQNILSIKSKMCSVITISETLSLEVKEKLSQYFGIQVLSRYSNVENGILAQQKLDGSDEFELNQASYYFEILDLNEDKKVADGQIGRIVITDLYNYAMPMIRYDTGDVGAVIESAITGRKVLVNLEGRKLDVLYNTSGELVSSLLVYKNMWQYKEIDQYQLIQKDRTMYTLKISAQSGFGRQAEIIDEYKQYLGGDAIINIEIVEEIPLLASGKRRKVVNEFYK